jgi:hypothetical protein
MTTITAQMIDDADDATLLRYQRELLAEAEQVTEGRKAELSQAFTAATRYIAEQADGNGHRQGYIDEAEEARRYMPEWLLPWLPEPDVKVEGVYVFYADALVPQRPDRPVTNGHYQPTPATTTGEIPGAHYVSNYGSLHEYLRARLPNDLFEQVRTHVAIHEPEVRPEYRLSQ